MKSLPTLLAALALAFAAAGASAQAPAAAAPAALTPAQQTAVTGITTSTQMQTQAVTTARTALTAASLALPRNQADITAKAAAVAQAELALANARVDAISAIQTSANRMTAAQLAQVGAGGGRGGGRGAAAGAPARKRLLIWADTRNGQAQHEFVSHAMGVIEQMGRQSGLWDTTIRTDSEIISYAPKNTTGGRASGGPSLGSVDAIFSLVHREAPITAEQKTELLRFVHDDGKGFLTAHTGLTAFLTWPEFREMVGGGYGGHSIGYPHTLVVEDPKWPGASAFPLRIPMEDEWYTLTDYSREKIHVILRLDLSDYPNPPAQTVANGGDFPVAWARQYGNGRVFASTFAHQTEMWDNPMVRSLYFESIKWALKITDADVTPRPYVKSLNAAPAPAATQK